MPKKSMLIVLAVSVAAATIVPQAVACYQCNYYFQCVTGYSYGGQACVSNGTSCTIYIPCAAYHVPPPDGLPPKIIRTSCKDTLISSGQRVSLKEAGTFKQFVSLMDAGEFSGEGTRVFMGRDVYRRLPTINWKYVSDKEVSYTSKETGHTLRGHLYRVTTESGSKVDVVVVG